MVVTMAHRAELRWVWQRSGSVVGTYRWSLNVQSGSVSRNQKPLEATRSHRAGDPGLPRVEPVNPAQTNRCWRVGTHTVAPGTSHSFRAVLPLSCPGPWPLTGELHLKEQPGARQLPCSAHPLLGHFWTTSAGVPQNKTAGN